MPVLMKSLSTRSRSGFTLIEVVMSLSVMSVLMLGLSGAVMVSSRAIPTATDTGLADQAVIDAINLLREDLREATTVRYLSSATGTTIEMGIKNTGTSGAPSKVIYTYTKSTFTLTRQVDLLASVTLISGVDAFAVSLTLDGPDVSVVYALIAVKDTIQRFYELHALLPDKPVNL